MVFESFLRVFEIDNVIRPNKGRLMPPKFIFLLSCLFVMSCTEEKEDPVLREKYEKQKVEIEHLTADLKDAAEKVAEMRIADPTANLEELKEQKATLEEEREALEAELRGLQRELKQAGEDLSSYQRKYSLEQN